MSVFDEGRPVDAGPSRNRPHGNLRILQIAVVVAFLVLAARLAQMQILDGAEYAERSKNNHISQSDLLPTRGLVYDRNGEPLVANAGTFTATIIPAFLPGDAEEEHRIYLDLERILEVPVLEMQTRVALAVEDGLDEIAIRVAENLTREQALMIEEAAVNMPGVALTVSPSRQYIAGDEFSHILGYAGPQTPEDWALLRDDGYAFNESIGKTGVEASYQSVLRGEPGATLAEIDAQGEVLDTLEELPPEDGSSLRLAIDSGFQKFTSDLLLASMAEADVAAAVAMDANTGEILALVSVPSYDNNIFGALDRNEDEYERLLNDPRKPLLNQALSPAAPGSTFKLITAAAGLQEGTLTPASGFNVDSLTILIPGEDGILYPFEDWRVHGYVNTEDAIAWSSNQFFYMASCGYPHLGIGGLGKDTDESAVTLGYYARAFGLGETTGIDVVGGEAGGIVPNPEWKRRVTNGEDWFYADTCFMGIGQGDVTATPVQIAAMTAAVANGGYLLEPHVVSETIAPDGTITPIEPEWTKVPVSDEHLETIRRGMLQGTTSGAAVNAAVPGVQVAGKTGTAEFTLPGDSSGTLYNHAWYTGFAPYNDPEIVVTVYFDYGWGGDKAAPVAAEMVKYYMENIANGSAAQ